MAYNFDQHIQRWDTNSFKYDFTPNIYGTSDILPMWVADMDFPVPPFIIEALQKRLDHNIFGYTFRADSFNQSVLNWLERRHGWQIEKDWIQFSPGIVPAINLSVLALSNEGDEILVQTPVYHPFFSAVTDHKRQLSQNILYQNQLGAYEIDFNDLENKLKNASLFILCNPHNPVGRVWSLKELQKMGDLCIKHDVIILSDEIHSDLILPGYKHIPIASISEEIAQRTLTYMAPSKTFNIAGLSTSVVISKNKELLDRFSKLMDILHMGMGNVFGNIALEAAYRHGAYWVDELNQYIAKNIEYVTDFLQEKLPQIKIIKPEATYLVWLDFRELKMNENQLNEFLVKKAKLGFNKGSMFGAGGEGFQRMNVGCPKSTVFKAMNQLFEAIQHI